jgi:peptidoglycan hydrolase-like protein with peptidoglycan-binding domain
MKQLIAGMLFVALATVVVSPATVRAQTTTATTDVSSLITLLQSLMKQVEELQKQLSSLRGEVQQVRAELRAGLREGVENDDVKKIQELLATDPTIYPKGLVSGYYGPLTKEAVMAFQKRHGLPETGVVDEATRKLLQDYLNKKTDKVVAPGWIKAPGLDKKITEQKKTEDKKVESKKVEDKKTETKLKDTSTIKGHADGMIKAATDVIADLEDAIEDAKDNDEDEDDIEDAEEDLARAEAELNRAKTYFSKGEYQKAYDEAVKAKMSAYAGIDELN